MQPPEPIDPNFRIELPDFEGPLDLLLHLIQKHELDILDLPIAFVTERYLSYLGLMKQLNLDVASEYLVMAAKLAHIKSKMLLPAPPADQEDEEQDEDDPREELIRRLLEYQKYKNAAEDLGSRGVAGRDVFMRGIPAPEAEGPAPLADTSLFKLLDAFQRVLERTKGDLSFEVSAERIGIQERISQITEMLQGQRSVAFDYLFEEVWTKYDVVVTFLAILEMAKMRMMRIYQADPHAPIHLEYRVVDASDVGDGEGVEQVPTDEEPREPTETAQAAGAAPADETVAPEETDDGETPTEGEDPTAQTAAATAEDDDIEREEAAAEPAAREEAESRHE